MALNCIHLDCGRKYFSPESIKKLIDLSAEAGFRALELRSGMTDSAFSWMTCRLELMKIRLSERRFTQEMSIIMPIPNSALYMRQTGMS